MERKILKASAGTGKTYRLSLEYIFSLLEGEKTKDIIVMTFTKKATSEIKERILGFLKDLAEKNEKGIEAAQSIIELYPEKYSDVDSICEKAKDIFSEVILNKDSLKIFTIDGLKNLIFKTAIAPMLNINFSDIIDDSQNIDYLRKCFEKIFRNRKDFDILKNFLEANVERDADKYVEVIKNIIDERWKSLIISKTEREYYEINGTLNQLDKSLEALEKIFEKKGKENETLKSFVKSEYYPYLEKNTQEEKEKFIYDNWSLIFEKDIKNGTKAKNSKKINILDELEEIAEQHENLQKELAKRIFNDTIIPYEKEILSFLERVYKVYDEIKFREKKFTHGDITNYTLEYLEDSRLNLVDENGITEYMKDVLESNVTTIFIDEFQDTSVVQWKIFKNIIHSAEKVICVGDDKQSIYGWREGDKNLFINLSKIINGSEENLGTSYRSCKKIVDFTNKFFEKYSQEAGNLEINWNFECVESSKKDDEGYIEIADCGDYAVERIIETLKDKFNDNYKGIGILARNNDTLNEIAQALSENQIPYFLETNLDIFSHRTIVPVVKLLKYFVYNNIFYLTEFLRDDFVLISDSDLKEFLTAVSYSNTDFNIENINFSNENLNSLLKEILNFKNKFIENQDKNIDILTEIIENLGILEKYKNESDIQNVYSFIDVSKNFSNIQELLKEIEENSKASEYKQSSIEMKNAVTLMSIHKSKGLEFDTVFYVHKENSSRADAGVQFNICMSEDYGSVEDYLIIDGKFEKILSHLKNRYDYALDKKNRREEEEINNLYVALTRPRNNLFIFLAKMKKESLMRKVIFENFLSEEMPAWSIGKIKFSDESSSENKENEKDTKNKENNLKDLKLDFSDYIYNEEKIIENSIKLAEEEKKFSTEREEKREVGTAIHYFLENLINNTLAEREKAEKLVLSKYGASFGKENLTKILKSDGLKNFLSENEIIFSKNWDMIFPEYSIYSDKDKKLYRLDRVMIKKSSENERGKILVVDYKTGSFEENQLENYIFLVKQELSRIKQLENYDVEGKYLQIEI